MDPRGAGAVTALAARAGVELPAIARSRSLTAARLAERRDRLPDAAGCSVVFVGSWGRGELTRDSDDDWMVLATDEVGEEALASYVAAVGGALDGKPPGPEAIFAAPARAADLAGNIGLAADTNANLTRRMLLLLESVALTQPGVYAGVRTEVLDAYLATRSSDRRPPRFLLNDVVRYWRTVAVDFEGKHRARGGDAWGLRTAKLRVSRKVLFASGLLPVLECHRLRRADMAEFLAGQFAAPPLDRVAAMFLAYDAVDPGARLLLAYDRFLAILDDEVARAELAGLAESEQARSQAFAEVRGIADTVQSALLTLLFDDRRLAAVTREYAVF